MKNKVCESTKPKKLRKNLSQRKRKSPCKVLELSTQEPCLDESIYSVSEDVKGASDDVYTCKISEKSTAKDEDNHSPSQDLSIYKVGKRIKSTTQRTEASQNVSEFNLNEVGKEKVKLDDLINASLKLVSQKSIRKQLENAKKLKSLPVPLSKPEQTKISRAVAYEKVCNEVSKWEPVVRNNRVAPQTMFPLKKPRLYMESLESTAAQFVAKHPVEVAMDELLNKSENKPQEGKTLSVAEEKAIQAMSLEEAKLRHSELMKHRALVSYQEEKARRQNKIKSKSYHRILKREKLKKIMKDFEALEKTDAAAAVEKLMEADMLRVLERMTLKHRNTGKWAKVQKLRAKYNPEARSNLKEDVMFGRQLKEKLPGVEEKIRKLQAASMVPELEDEEDNLHEAGLIEATSSEIAPQTISETENNQLVQRDNLSINTDKDQRDIKLSKVKDKSSEAVTDSSFAELDAAILKSYKPNHSIIGDNMDVLEGDDESDDEMDEGIKNVREAFADEDLIAEFREEKKAAEQGNRCKGIDTYLPGWGMWGGPTIKEPKWKKKKFFIRTEAPALKKSTMGNVIFNENMDKSASVHQIRNLPFPFTNVKQFERHIQHPVGGTWNPQSSFQQLTAPRVVTKVGKIIEPIEADDTILDKSVQLV